MTRASRFGSIRFALRWVGRGVLALVALVLLAAVLGFAWQSVGVIRDVRRYPAPGSLIDVGGRRLHLDCRGEGAPTVIIEAGAQDWSTGWQRPQAAMARHTRVCAYDRAGLGWSEASADPKDGAHMVEDLHRLMAAADMPRPVVLVGHSLGGMLNRIYYQRHPEDVAGLVLIEPGDPEQIDAMFEGTVGEPAFGGWVDTLASVAARLGVVRWMYRDLFKGKGYPDGEVAATRARMVVPSAVRALASTVRHLPVTSAQTRANDSLGELPVAVVYTSRFDEVGTSFDSEAERREFRAVYIAHWEFLASLSTRGGPPIVVEGANHITLIRDDDYWPLAVEVILDTVDEVRALSLKRQSDPMVAGPLPSLVIKPPDAGAARSAWRSRLR